MYISPIISSDKNEKKYYRDTTLNRALKDFRLTSENIVYSINRDKEQAEPLSMIRLDNGTVVLPA